MNQYQIFICGNFGYLGNQLDGQTVKTRQLKDKLAKELGKQNIIYSDMSEWKKRPLSMYKEVKHHLKNSKTTIVLLGPKGISLLLPRFVKWKNKYSKDLRYIVIGGWLPTLAEKNKVLTSALKSLNGIYVETPSMKHKLRQLGLTNISVIPNFRQFQYVDDVGAGFHACPYLDNNRIQLPIKAVILSRIIKEKGIHTAIEAVKSINKAHGKVCITLDIYGQLNKKYAAEFQSIIGSNSTNITYKGYLETEKIQPTLMQYDLMIFPTYYHGEGFPGAIIDAYTAGLPIVASDWKYNREVVVDGTTGIFFEPQNTADLVQKLNMLISDLTSIKNMRYHCLNKAREYHIDIVLAELIEEMRRV
jgi:glycosyltransferase involved in cell wall biosynthesis